VRSAGLDESDLTAIEARERIELERRARRYRGDRPRIPLTGRTAVVVDDGIATGSTARAACRVARAHGADRVVLAVPVAPRGWTVSPGDDADDLVCVDRPTALFAISQSYLDFSQTSDEEVIACLDRCRPPEPEPHAAPGLSWLDPSLQHAREQADGVELFEDPFADEAVLAAREEAEGVEVFAPPEAVIPATALREGSPGHEAYGGDQVGLEIEDEVRPPPPPDEA
jgi:hypothetical protein